MNVRAALAVLAVSLSFGEVAHAHDLPLVELHGTLAWDQGIHGGWGPGAGARIAIPVLRGTHFGNVPDEIAFTFGGGWLYFSCPYGTTSADCPDANVIWAPLGLAWSFAVHRNLSLFVEPGLGAFVSFFREACPAMGAACQHYDHAGLRPLVSLGATVHLGPVAIVLRAGFPTFSLGVGL